jgi:hypothetical protein
VAATVVNAWIPVEYGGKLFEKVAQQSALLTITGGVGGRRETMTTRTKRVPKASDVSVQFTAKGATYGLDTTAVGDIELISKKMTAGVQLDEEDIADSKGFVDTVKAKREAAFRGFATLLDNAAFAVSGDITAEPDMTRPYDSLYHQMIADGDIGAQRFDYDLSSGTTAQFRSAMLGALAYAEASEWNDGTLTWFLSDAFRPLLRDNPVDGSNGLPIWSTGENTILAYQIANWSRGLRESAVASQNPTGPPLAFVGPRSLIVAGVRDALSYRVTDSDTGIGALSDTTYLLARQRIAANIGDPTAFGVVRLVP